MNDNDSRREREITELARLLPVPDGRDLPADREQILKEHLMTELRRTEAPRGQRRIRRPVLIAAAVAVAVEPERFPPPG